MFLLRLYPFDRSSLSSLCFLAPPGSSIIKPGGDDGGGDVCSGGGGGGGMEMEVECLKVELYQGTGLVPHLID